MEEVGPYFGMEMPHTEGPYHGIKMRDVDPRTILEMYFTNHFVGLPRMWVVHNMARLKEACEWTEEDRVVIRTNPEKLIHRNLKDAD